MALNLEKQLQFYGAYHHNPTNVAIHMTCVPAILMTTFAFGCNTPSLIPLPSFLRIPNLPPNLGTIHAIAFSTLYILLEPVAGTMITPILLGGTAWANKLVAANPAKTNKIAIAVHVLSWIMQFVGHGAFEGRAPALLDNLLQAVVLAPFFVWMEFLFKLGYRPELKARLDKAVAKEIARIKAEKAAKKTNGTVKDGEKKDLK